MNMTKKQITSIILAICFVFTGLLGIRTEVLAGTVTPAPYEFEYQYSDYYQGIEILKYTGKDADISIPAEIEGQSVTAIGAMAFIKCNSLRTVTVPDSVKIIGAGAFELCASLEKVTLPQNLREIPKDLFFQCPKLNEVNIPNGVTKIGNSAFSGCKSLTGIKIPASVTALGSSVFAGCTKLKKITFAAGSRLETVDEQCFSNCKALKSITLPASLKKLASHTFSRSYLKTIHINKNAKITVLPDECFANCYALQEVDIPKKITKIGKDLFVFDLNMKKEYLNKVKKVNIMGSRVKLLGEDSFKGIHKKAVFCVPSKFKTKYQRLLKKQSWYKASMKIR